MIVEKGCCKIAKIFKTNLVLFKVGNRTSILLRNPILSVLIKCKQCKQFVSLNI